MKIKVYENRQLNNESNYYGTTFENLATTLFFEFPEFVTKKGIPYKTSDLNKYIIFEDGSQDLILDDKYSIPYSITSKGSTIIFIKLVESSDSDDLTDKLIWYSEGLPIQFATSIEGQTEITKEKIDAFNTLYSKLNLEIGKVQDLKNYIDKFKQDVELGLYNRKRWLYSTKRHRLFYRI